jgi:hypothetical protein
MGSEEERTRRLTEEYGSHHEDRQAQRERQWQGTSPCPTGERHGRSESPKATKAPAEQEESGRWVRFLK